MAQRAADDVHLGQRDAEEASLLGARRLLRPAAVRLLLRLLLVLVVVRGLRLHLRRPHRLARRPLREAHLHAEVAREVLVLGVAARAVQLLLRQHQPQLGLVARRLLLPGRRQRGELVRERLRRGRWAGRAA